MMPAAMALLTASREPRTSSSVQSRELTTLTAAPSQRPSARRRQASAWPHRTSRMVARDPATQVESAHEVSPVARATPDGSDEAGEDVLVEGPEAAAKPDFEVGG